MAEFRMPSTDTHYVAIDRRVYQDHPDPLPSGWATVAFVPKSQFSVGAVLSDQELPYYVMSLDHGGWQATYNKAVNPERELFATAELCDEWQHLFFKPGYKLIHNLTGKTMASRFK